MLDNQFRGFKPVYNNNSRILILGSFPSVISRNRNFYYSNRQNRFWKMLSLCFNQIIEDSIEEKIAFLLNNRIALWDIVTICKIKGSSDSNINVVEIANLNYILQSNCIEKILCNGRKAYDLTIKYYNGIDIPIIYMPSTSSANTRFDINFWIKELFG